MKKALVALVNTFWQPVVRRYIARPTRYRYGPLRIVVQPGVFHPRFFFSTKLLLRYLGTVELRNRSFLELGAGSGLISLFAAQHGASVLASDISPIAVENVRQNQQLNQLVFPVLHSDLFTKIAPQTFDLVVINPPYYKKSPASHAEHAWYCGENGEYFTKLFSSLRPFMHGQSQVIMILSDACDIAMISAIAGRHQFALRQISEHRLLLEKNFLFSIVPLGS